MGIMGKFGTQVALAAILTGTVVWAQEQKSSPGSAQPQDNMPGMDMDNMRQNADQSREDRDLSKGDVKGAEYWNKQRKDENAEISHDKKDLAHSDLDVKNAKARLSKDVSVRNHDVAKRNKAASKI